MRICEFAAVLAATVILVAGCSSRAHDDVSDVVRDRWHWAQSSHFTVYTNLSRADAAKVARRLERLDVILDAVLPTTGAPRYERTEVYAFKNDESFGLYTDPRQEAGFTTLNAMNTTIACTLPGHSQWSTLAHELTHECLHRRFPRLPIWLDEGMAEYFTTTTEHGDVATYGRAPIEYAWALRNWWPHSDRYTKFVSDGRNQRSIPPLSIDELFAVESQDSLQADRLVAFELESWALVRHLVRVRGGDFERFAGRAARGEPAEEAFAQIVPRDRWADLLDKACTDASSASPGVGETQSVLHFPRVTITSGAMPISSAVLHLGVLALRRNRRELAENLFRRAIEFDSHQASAIAALGELADTQGDTAAAESLYAEAARRGRSDVSARWFAARGTFRRQLILTEGEPWPEWRFSKLTRDRFAECLELAPSHMGAGIGYAMTFVFGDSAPPPNAIARLRSASEIQPWSPELVELLVVLLGRAGRWSEADSLLEHRIKPLGDDEARRVLDWECDAALDFAQRSGDARLRMSALNRLAAPDLRRRNLEQATRFRVGQADTVFLADAHQEELLEFLSQVAIP